MGHARTLPYVEDVTIFGNSLHLLVRGEIADTEIARDLAQGTAARVDRAADRADARGCFCAPDEDPVGDRARSAAVRRFAARDERSRRRSAQGMDPDVPRPVTLRMAFVIPMLELVLFGLIDTNVRHVPTAILDESRTRESRELVTRARQHRLLRHDRPRRLPGRAAAQDRRRGSVGRRRDSARFRASPPERPARGLSGADRRLGLHDLLPDDRGRERRRVPAVSGRSWRAARVPRTCPCGSIRSCSSTPIPGAPIS